MSKRDANLLPSDILEAVEKNFSIDLDMNALILNG